MFVVDIEEWKTGAYGEDYRAKFILPRTASLEEALALLEKKYPDYQKQYGYPRVEWEFKQVESWQYFEHILTIDQGYYRIETIVEAQIRSQGSSFLTRLGIENLSKWEECIIPTWILTTEGGDYYRIREIPNRRPLFLDKAFLKKDWGEPHTDSSPYGEEITRWGGWGHPREIANVNGF